MSGGAKFGGSDNRVQEISEISRGLKGVARELNVPLIAPKSAQLIRESRSPQIPQLADLRELAPLSKMRTSSRFCTGKNITTRSQKKEKHWRKCT